MNKLSENMTENIKDSFKMAFSGMAIVVLAIASFIVLLWIVITVVRAIAGLG